MNRLNPRNPMVIDTRELQRRPGSMQEVSRVVGAPEDLGTEVISVPMGAPVELELRLESVVEGVLLSGSVSATATGACVRCLETATYPVEVTLQELFAYPDRAAHHLEVAAESDEDDVRELVDDLIDLEPVLRDAVVPALPFQPVCRVDCPGLCSECGALLAQDPDHHHDLLDPRWASLSGLLGDAGRGSAETEKRN
ncbi:MAG: YceD family protein [Lapillicoccus sp.]